MNKITEQEIEDKLKTLASIEPSEASRRRMNNCVRKVIVGSEIHRPITRSFFYYALVTAAMLLCGIALLWQTEPIEKPHQIVHLTQTEPAPTLANLNAVFTTGGQQALDEYFEKIEQNRQPRAETITLQELLKEL